MTNKKHTGGCHCGKVRYEIKSDLAKFVKCNCSICSKKGILHHMVEKEDFILISGKEYLKTYQFGHKTAQHIFCTECGIHSFGVPRSKPDGYTVNVNCLDNPNLANSALIEFNGQNWEQSIEKLRKDRVT